MISPLAVETVERFDTIFAVERAINGLAADDRRAVRQCDRAPLVSELHDWMVEHR